MRETESKFLEDPGNSELFKKQEEATSAITSEEPTEIADKTIEKAASKKRKQSVADEKAKVKKEKGKGKWTGTGMYSYAVNSKKFTLKICPASPK